MPNLQTRLEEQRGMLLKRATLMLTAAEKEQRALSADEETAHAALLAQIEATDKHIDRAQSDDAIGAAIHALTPATLNGQGMHALPPGLRGGMLSLGAQFEKALGPYFESTRGGARGASWRSPSAELVWPGGFSAATLTEDPASGGKLVVPDFRPGIVPSATAPLAVADLFTSSPTNSNLVVTMRETSFVNASDTVAEGAAKPESTLIFDAVNDPVRKIATFLPVTDEMLEDVVGLRSYIDARLRLGVQLTLDEQLLSGTTVAPDIVGVRNRAGLGAPVAVGTASAADAIAAAIAQVQTTTSHPASGVVLHPSDWLTIQLSKTEGSGEYLGGGPFASPTTPTLWGVPVAVTPLMPQGTALVGAFKTAAMVFYKGGLRVEASNSHQDWFQKNLVAIRAELRAALAVMVPLAFVEVTGIPAVPPA